MAIDLSKSSQGENDREPLTSRASAQPSPSANVAAAILRQAFEQAMRFRLAKGTASLRPAATVAELRSCFDVGLPSEGRVGTEIIASLAKAAEPGLVGNTGPDFFGWVVGASHPVGVAADWLAAAWGQNSATYQTSPAAAVAEEVAARWLVELLQLPPQSSVGFTTGATMASFICLATARSEALARAGYDLEREGLSGTPPIAVFVGREAHATVFSVLRYLGFGRKNIVIVEADAEGRMRAVDLRAKLGSFGGPKIIVGQAGHINSGAFDPFQDLADLAKAHSAWLHIDGAFGLWARAAPELRHKCDGAEAADSWAVDGHKWLQVPYDSGFAIVKNETAHKAAMETSASYIAGSPDDRRNPTQYGPELSRRARGFAVWAVIQALGRKGIAELVLGHCRLAQRLKGILEPEPGIRILNEVALNQLAICFEGTDSEVSSEELTNLVVDAIQRENTSFVEGATWKDRRILRVSIISLGTCEEDVDRLGRSIVRAWSGVRATHVRAPSSSE